MRHSNITLSQYIQKKLLNISYRIRNNYQRRGHSGRGNRRSTGHGSFDKENNSNFKRKEDLNKKEEENRKEMYFFFKEPVDKKEFKFRL